MPSVNDIVSVAEALEKSPVAVLRDRCVVVRNRNATCRRCVKVCAANAIEISNNEVDLSVSLCNGCGACTAVCPTEALVPVASPDSQLVPQAVEAMRKNGNRAVVACARAASKRVANPELYAEVACLPRLEESLLLTLVAQGAEEVVLVDGDCPTCKYRDCVSHVNTLVDSVNELVAAHGAATRVARRTGFPDDMIAESTEGMFGTTRRGFFSEAVSAAKDTAMTAAQTTLAQELGYTQKTPEIGERLRVTESGTLPLVPVARHEAAINALDAIGAPVTERIDSRLFGSVSIDVEKCNACGMCAVFCPTGALVRDSAGKVNEPLRYLEFSAADCVQCGLCADVCWKRALTLDTGVSTSELYDFEPVTFDLSRAKRQTNSLFGKTRSK